MTTYMLHVQETDQKFPIPAEVGVDDSLVKRALAGVVPYIDTAKLTREEKDGITTIKVIKSHAPKGAGDAGSSILVIRSLAQAHQDGNNPVALLYRQLVNDGIKLESLKPDQHLALSSRIDKAIEAGEQVHHEIQATIQYLIASLQVEAKSVPMGF